MQLDRSRYVLDFDEDFAGTELDRARWLPHYLPHWAGEAASEARYALADGVLSLRIDADSPVWNPEVAPGMRVSNLQTGHLAGPVGGTIASTAPTRASPSRRASRVPCSTRPSGA
jgi:hypothetical protein